MAQSPGQRIERTLRDRVRVVGSAGGVALLRGSAGAWRGQPRPHPAAAVLPLRRIAAVSGAFLTLELLLVGLAAAGPSVLVPPSRAGFPSFLAGPLGGLFGDVRLGTAASRDAFVVLVGALVVCYGLVAAWGRECSARFALSVVGAAVAVMFLAPPLFLTDVFNYLSFAHVGVLHRVNPYVVTPAAFPHDPALPFGTWHDQPDPYGPLFTLATYPLAPLGLGAGLWTLKAATAAAALGATALLGACAERLGRPPGRAMLLFGLNPVVLVYGLGGVHNDFFMVLLALAGLHLVLRTRARAAGWALAGAVAIKAVALPPVAFVLIGARRRALVVSALGAAAALAALAFLAFGPHASGLAEQAAAVTRYSVPHLLAAVVGQGAYRPCAGVYVCVGHGVQLAAAAAQVLGLAWLVWRARRGADWIALAGWAGILSVATLASTMPWYLIWILPFAVLSRSRALAAATVLVGAFLLLTATPFPDALGSLFG
jgi:hypothetical protein